MKKSTRWFCSKISMFVLSLLTIITDIGRNMEIEHSDRKQNCAGSGLSQFLSGVKKGISCVPNLHLKTYTDFGKYDNVLSFNKLKWENGHNFSVNVTVNIPTIVKQKPVLAKQYNGLVFFSLNEIKTLRKEYSTTDIVSCAIYMLVLLVTYTNITFCFRNIKHCSRTHNESKTLRSYDFIFQLGNQPFLEVKVFPLSLKKYFNEIDHSSDKNSTRMNYEWARIESFKTFPNDCPASTLRLAQAGFYNTGKGQGAVCFCCGLSNEKWTDEESVVELHKRLSPNCKFINGEETENIPIHGNERATGGACGGPGDITENDRNTRENNDYCCQDRNRSVDVNQDEENLEHLNLSTVNSYQNTLENKERPCIRNGYSERHSEYRPVEEIIHFPGITNEHPKHPDYAIKNVRLSSFSQWPSTNVMKPDDLVEAGFFFCGMQDMVRCFFCGGGIKNWEFGDSPWIEHARWFPTCAYLKQCKGQDFINLCQMSNMTFPSQTNFQLRDLDSQQANGVEDQTITDLNSIAAKLVLDMGYSQTQVEDAVRHTRQRIGTKAELKAHHLLEYLLDNSYTRANTSDITNAIVSDQPSETFNNNGHSISPNTNQHHSAASNNTTGRISPELRTESSTSDKTHKTLKAEKRALKEENQHLKEQMLCKICMDKDANIVFLPCGHLVSCIECAHALRKCAVCRTVIQGTVRTYHA